jgi:hypothetical protein
MAELRPTSKRFTVGDPQIFWTDSLNHYLPLGKTAAYMVMGKRGAGKSNDLEYLACQTIERGGGIFDLFGARDSEGLAWLRSPYVNGSKVLLLHGPNTSITSSYDHKIASEITLGDFDRYDMIISPAAFYTGPAQEFYEAGKIIGKIYLRSHYSKIISLIVREAGNLYYARLSMDGNQYEAKAAAAYMAKEARHSGFSCKFDTVRSMSIDIDIRVTADIAILKRLGRHSLPRDMWYVYHTFRPEMIARLQQNTSIIITDDNYMGVMDVPFLPWHKTEKEDLLALLDIRVDHNLADIGEVKESETHGSIITVGDRDHIAIVSLYTNPEQKLSMSAVGVQMNPKRSAYAVFSQIHAHDTDVIKHGFCAPCRRQKCSLESKLLDRKKQKVNA